MLYRLVVTSFAWRQKRKRASHWLALSIRCAGMLSRSGAHNGFDFEEFLEPVLAPFAAIA